ncbi:MAG TPA: peptidylprolyl isomerase [Brevundimonas sp.]|jgi:peptidylprolyl isomerase|uniref:peptidylprolyl isomerase n=1 Tax=Brevundimonas sp. TaxID=1871086 RepID=UPI002DF623A7|nr:peptidylprolyl isomerase [Brevundimonas sp.]
MKLAACLSVAAALTAGAASAQDVWRTVDPANLLVIDTVHGRILVEMEPRMAPNHVERVRTLADRGFYDGVAFHRVIPDFMAQTGDPTGTGAGGSDLPDVKAEFAFRRGAADGFVAVPNAGAGLVGLMGSMPVSSQPDAQMMFTVDKQTPATGLFCPAVVGMARSGPVDSANSQFYLMTGRNDRLNGAYTPFGRVLQGMDAVRALKAGDDARDGAVQGEPDRMVRVRTAAALPEGERPAIRVMEPASPTYQASIETVRTARGPAFNVCDLMPTVEVIS